VCYSVMVEQDLDKISKAHTATVHAKSFNHYESLSKSNPKKFKPLSENPRIYPGYFLPVVVEADTGRKIVPMRYRVRPAGSLEEVPSKYNMFNARLESLDKRKTWSQLLMKRHGIIMLRSFFEWVEDKETGKKKIVEFTPKGEEHISVPVLWDEYISDDSAKPSFRSCAIVTTTPNQEVLDMGHDRSPVFFPESNIDTWLSPTGHTQEEIIEILNKREKVYYMCRDASA
jgi:putative SOS response-associated peptidase YedK